MRWMFDRQSSTLILTLALAGTPVVVFAQTPIEQLFQQGQAAETALQPNRAEEIWQQVVQLEPKNAEAYRRLGDARRRQDKFDPAWQAYERALQLNPQDPEVYVGMGYVLIDTNKPEEASSLCQKAVQLNPNLAKAYNCLGNILHGRKKLDEAIAAYEKAIQLDPQFFYAYRNLGDVLLEQKQLDRAIAAYQKAIQINPQYYQAYINLGIALSNQKEFDREIVAYRKAIEINPKDTYTYIVLGNALSNRQKYDQAIVAYQKSIEINPKNPYAYFGLGYALLEWKKSNEAIVAYQKAIDLKPDYADAYYNLGIALSNNNKLDDAINAYQTAIKFNSKYSAAYLAIGNVLRLQKNLDKAIDTYQKAIQLDPKDSYAYYALGNILYFDKKQYKLALAAYGQSIKLNPNLVCAYGNIAAIILVLDAGTSNYEQANLEKVIAIYRNKIKKTFPGIDNASSNKIISYILTYREMIFDYRDKKRFDLASESLKKSVELNPQNEFAYLFLGILFETHGKLEDSVLWRYKYAKIQLSDASDFDIYMSLAEVFLNSKEEEISNRQRNLQKAEIAINKAIALQPKNASVYFYLGQLRIKQKEPELAIQAFRKTIEFDAKSIDAHVILSYLLTFKGDFAASHKILQSAFQIDPNNSNAYNSLGLYFNQQGKLKDAETAFSRAKQLNQNDVFIDTNLCLNLRLQERQNEAEPFCAKVRRSPNTPGFPSSSHATISINDGLQNLKQCKLSDAMKDFQRAETIDPEITSIGQLATVAQSAYENLNRQKAESITDDGAWLPKKKDDPDLEIKRSVVRITAKFVDIGASVGTGIVIARDTNRILILTTRHIIFDKTTQYAQNIQVEFFSYPPSEQVKMGRSAKIVKSTLGDSNIDLVLLEIDSSSLPPDIQPLAFTKSGIDDKKSVRIIGHDNQGTPWSTVSGEVSVKSIDRRRMLAISQANLQPGYSGSPVLDRQNHILGIVVSRRKDKDKDYAYHVSEIRKQLSRWNISLSP